MKAQVRKSLRSLALRIPQIRVLHEQVLAANKSMADLRSMNERLRSTNAVVGVQLNEVSNQLARAQRESSDLRSELSTVLAAQPSPDYVEDNAREIHDLRKQLSTLAGEFAQLNSAREQADQAYSAIAQELEGAKAARATAEDARIALRSELDRAAEAAGNVARTEELTHVLNRERSRASALASDFGRVQLLLSISQDENARLARELADLEKSSVDRADAQVKAAQAAETRALAAEKATGELNKLAREATSERDKAVARAIELAALTEALQKDLQASRLEAKHLAERLADREAHAEDLSLHIEEAQKIILSRDQELEVAHQSEVELASALDQTRERLNVAHDAMSKARFRTDELEAVIVNQDEELGSLRRQLEETIALAARYQGELQAKLVEAASVAAEERIQVVAGLEMQLAEARKLAAEERRQAVAVLEAQLAEQESLRIAAEQNAALDRARSEAALARVTELESHSGLQDKNLSAAKIQAAELRSALEAALLRAQSAEARTEEVLSRARELEQMIARGQEELRAAEAAHQADKLEAQGELAALTVRAGQARREVNDLESLVERNREELHVIELRAAGAVRQLAEIQEQLGGMAVAQSRIASLEAELAGQRDVLNAAENSKAAMQHERDQLAYQLKVQMPETLARILGKITKAEDSFERERIPAPRAVALQDPAAVAAVLRDRYLDLLEGALTGTLYEDAPMSPWSTGYDPEIRSLGRDWPARALTMIGTTRMRNVRRVLEDVLARDVPGDFIETGVWRGGACIYARGIFAAYGARDRKVWVADSFNGLPRPSPNAYPEDRDDSHHAYEELRVSLNQVRQNFRDYGLLDDQVQFLKGWFSETLAKAPIDRLAVLRLDGDMYESTIQALDALYRKVSVGGYVIVDDYGLGPCKKAVDDFRAGLGIEDAILEIDGAAIYWRKTGAAETVGDRKLASVTKQG